MPATAQKLVQTGVESSWGSSSGSITIKVHGITDATLKINSEVEAFPQVGWFGPGPLAQEQAQSGEASWDMITTYQEGPRFLNAFFTAIINSTGSVAGTSSGVWDYPYTAPVTSTQAVSTYNIEYGSSGAAYRSLGSVAKHLNISGEAGGFWNNRIDWLSKQIITSSQLTTGLADRTVDPVRMANTTLYIDAFSTGTIGATAVTATLISFELDVESNRHLKQFAGSINPAAFGDARWEGTLRLTAEFNASAKALVDELLGSTGAAVSRQIRIGATQGSSQTLRTFNIDFAGIKTEGETLFSDRDGNMTVDLNWMGRYSTGLGNWLAFDVQVNSSSTT